MNPVTVRDAAEAVSAFLDALEARGLGPELTQKVVIAAAPTIVQAVFYPYDGIGYAVE